MWKMTIESYWWCSGSPHESDRGAYSRVWLWGRLVRSVSTLRHWYDQFWRFIELRFRYFLDFIERYGNGHDIWGFFTCRMDTGTHRHAHRWRTRCWSLAEVGGEQANQECHVFALFAELSVGLVEFLLMIETHFVDDCLRYSLSCALLVYLANDIRYYESICL